MLVPVAIRTEQVRAALRLRLGSDMVQETDVADRAADVLRGYSPYRDTLEALSERLCNTLFDCLYRSLGPRMTVRLDSGAMVRIRIQELPEVADDAMGALFEALTVYSVSYGLLKDYSLRSGSLSAMRVLYQRYDAFQSAQEKEIIARIVRDRYPAERYQAWLPAEAVPQTNHRKETNFS